MKPISKTTRLIILALIAATMILAAWWMNRGCPDTCRISYATAEGYNDLLRADAPVILPANQTVFRGPWQWGFADGIDCAIQFMQKGEPVQACRDRKWSELKAEMER